MYVSCSARLTGTVLAAVLAFASVSCGTAADESSDRPLAKSDTSDQGLSDTNDTANSDRTHADKSGTSKGPRQRGTTHLVVDVVDGDTVHLAKPGETSVRIIGIDTPETVHPSDPVECGGPSASAEARRLLDGQRVRLIYDPSQGRHDSYGRILGYIQVPSIGDFGAWMIRRGFAAEYTYETTYRKRSRYLAAQQEAQSASRGIWDRCGGVDTPLVQPKAEHETPGPTTDSATDECAPGYDPCVPSYPPDLDCDDVEGPITITGDDPHGFDADGDGIGCDT